MAHMPHLSFVAVYSGGLVLEMAQSGVVICCLFHLFPYSYQPSFPFGNYPFIACSLGQTINQGLRMKVDQKIKQS